MERTDRRFLSALTKIKADEVSFVPTPALNGNGSSWASDSKQESVVEKECLKAMVRKEKMYN